MAAIRKHRFGCTEADVLAVFVVFLVASLVLVILTAQEAPPAIEFSFSNPGARSMGLGGAFVALSAIYSF